MPFSSNSLARQAILYNSAMIDRLMAGRIIQSGGAKIARPDPAQAARGPRRPSKSRFVTAILPKPSTNPHEDFSLTKEQTAFRDSARDFARRKTESGSRR